MKQNSSLPENARKGEESESGANWVDLGGG